MNETISNPPTVKIDRLARRNVAIAGLVATAFSHTCKALDVDQQTVATKLVDGWNRRNGRRARAALERKARALCS